MIAGLVFANIDIHAYEDMVDYHIFGENTKIFGKAVTVHFLVNEIFMVFFFGIATKEITESVLPGGALNPIPKAINPLMGTLGGVIGPAGLFFLLAWVFYGGSSDLSTVANGWGIPTATDIALAWLVAHLKNGGFVLFDTQFLTSHLASLGAVEVSRAEYRARLADALIVGGVVSTS